MLAKRLKQQSIRERWREVERFDRKERESFASGVFRKWSDQPDISTLVSIPRTPASQPMRVTTPQLLIFTYCNAQPGLSVIPSPTGTGICAAESSNPRAYGNHAVCESLRCLAFVGIVRYAPTRKRSGVSGELKRSRERQGSGTVLACARDGSLSAHCVPSARS
jgi:hypothetical protein